MHLIAVIAVSALFASSSLLSGHAGESLAGPPAIGLAEAWALVSVSVVALAWHRVSRPV